MRGGAKRARGACEGVRKEPGARARGRALGRLQGAEKLVCLCCIKGFMRHHPKDDSVKFASAEGQASLWGLFDGTS